MSTSLRGSASRLTRAARAGDKVAVMKVAGICVGAGVGLWVVLGWVFWESLRDGYIWMYKYEGDGDIAQCTASGFSFVVFIAVWRFVELSSFLFGGCMGFSFFLILNQNTPFASICSWLRSGGNYQVAIVLINQAWGSFPWYMEKVCVSSLQTYGLFRRYIVFYYFFLFACLGLQTLTGRDSAQSRTSQFRIFKSGYILY